MFLIVLYLILRAVFCTFNCILFGLWDLCFVLLAVLCLYIEAVVFCLLLE